MKNFESKVFKYMEEKYFFRYQAKNRVLEKNSKSFGMIYSNIEEAIEDGCNVLNGVSCMSNPFQLWTGWGQYYDESYDIIVFKGDDTNATGNDGENVVEFIELIDTFDTIELIDWMYDSFEDFDDFMTKYYDFEVIE